MSELATIPASATNGTPRLQNAPVNRSLNMVQIMSDAPTFEQIQRASKMFAASTLVPEHLRGNVANVMIAMSIAFTLGEDPLSVMQNIYFVSGKAGWSASYMIGRANKSGKFKGNIDWRETGEGDSLVVVAYAIKADTGDEVSIDASMKMAAAEGWTRNSKYKSMPRLMLRYRAATMLIRLYAPEVMMGRTIEELEDIRFSQSDNDVVVDIPTGSLEDIINAPTALPEQPIDRPASEPSEPSNEIPDEQVGTHDAFSNALMEIGKANGIDAEIADKVIGKLRVSTKIASSRTSDAMKARREVLTAALDGKLDWNEGKING